MSLKAKETLSRRDIRRSYSLLGRADNNRFSPGTWIRRGLAIVSLLATGRAGSGSARNPAGLLGFIIANKNLTVMSETVQTSSVCQQTKARMVCCQTDGPTDGFPQQDQAGPEPNNTW